MATGKRPPPGIPGTRRRRPAPTIDLKATEIASEPAGPPPQPGFEAKPGFELQPAAEAASPPPPPEPPQTPPNEPPRPEREPLSPPPGHGSAWLPPDVPWPAVAAGAAGAAGVLLIMLVVWLIVPRSDGAAGLTPRLAAIETQLRELAARPAPVNVDPATLGALSERMAKLESALNAPRPLAADPALGGRVGALENALKPLRDSTAALGRRADETDATFRNIRGRTDAVEAALAELRNAARAASGEHDELAKLASRIAALEKSDRAVADELAKRPASNSDRPVRLAVAAAALRTAVERGDAFSAELATVKPLTNDAVAIAAIEPFAASGVPSATALGRELILLLPVMQRAAGTASRDGGFLDRLQANAEKLVRIRPVDEVPGEDTSAVLSRIEVKAAHADLAGALAELGKLSAAVRAPALAWIAKAEARSKSVDASCKLAADAIAALKTNP